jgi:isopenicillin N synthase-like dioxygenase
VPFSQDDLAFRDLVRRYVMPGLKTNSTGNFDRIPVVDIFPLYSADLSSRRGAALTLGAAARNAGFCYVTGHKIPKELIQSLVERARTFFSLPLDEKMRWYIGDSRHHRGYVPEGEEVFAGGTRDRKEAFDLSLDLPEDDSDVLAGTPLMGPNLWPDEGFRKDVGAYYRAALALGDVLFRGFALALGLQEHYFAPLVTKPPSQLRLIHYPYDQSAADAVGIGSHTDYECFTILLPTAPGLEVMNGAGEWIDSPPVEGTLIINIGDIMEASTNGEFVATSHRVRRVSEERYSFPLFCLCDYNTLVAPLPKFVSPDRPARYEPVIAGAHLFTRTTQSFRYLRRRAEAGDLAIPLDSKAATTFGYEARFQTESNAGSPD